MRSLPLLLALLLGASLLAGEPQAQARPPGNAQSFGVQRPVPAPKKVAPPQTPQPAAPVAASASGASGWLGPVTALAAGLGLGWLATQAGLGTLMVAALVGALAGAAVFALLRALPVRRPALDYALEEPIPVPPVPPQPAATAPRVATDPRAAAPSRVATAPAVAMTAAPIPADFDSASFIRQAKLNFIRLQDANDRGDLAALRQVTTDRMFDAILAELRPHRPAQHTDVVSLNASLLEVATEGETHSASVRFHGMIREDDGEAAPFEEVWHLKKPVSGASGWVLAGIQQVS